MVGCAPSSPPEERGHLALSAGTRFGAYEVLAPIGAGGMGEVYRAADTRLGRDVALKVLPAEVAGDPERLARFQREATLLASLNHPHIAAIYGLEEIGPQPCLVLELVEGEDLAARLARGPLPVDEALEIAHQVAEALEEAHARGIVHRDLKPANVKLTPEGKVKVLDFGLAKAWEADPGTAASSDLSQSPTLARSSTLPGVILGTAPYMSPEQAKGRPVDKRTDVWAFGALLFELLTGRRAFVGDDVSDTLAAVLRAEPDLARLPAATPPPVRRVLRLCLTKDARRRLHDMADVRLAMEGAFGDLSETTADAGNSGRRLPWVAAILASLVTGLVVWSLPGRAPSGPAGIVRFESAIPAEQQLAGAQREILAVAPDGRRFAYNTRDGIYVRSMDQLEARLLSGAGASPRSIFFSADGRSIGFQDDGQLKRIDLEGGAPVTICPAPQLLGAHWEADGTILFADGDRGILRVSATGGAPQLVVPAAEGEMLDSPQLLPDGDSVLFTIGLGTLGSGSSGEFTTVAWDQARIAVASLASGERTVVLQGGSDARYVGSGHLVFAVPAGLSAVAFDARGLRVVAGPVSLVEGLFRSDFALFAHYAVTDDGSLFYLAAESGDAPLVWVDRDGSAEAIGTLPAAGYQWPRLSPDGERLAVLVGGDAWIYEPASGRQVRLTDDGATNYLGWTPSGEEITYTSARGGVAGEVWIQPSDGSGRARQLTALGGRVDFDDWAPDGRTFAAHHHIGSSTHELMVAFDGESAEPAPWLEHDHGDSGAVFSPDGRFVAFISGQTGRSEIFIRPYPGPGRQTLVSIDGGTEAVWAPDGELFYRRSRDYTMMAVRVSTDPVLDVGAPVELFPGIAPPPGTSPTAAYDVTADGRRFVMSASLVASPGVSVARRQPRVIVVQNWIEELKRRVPVD